MIGAFGWATTAWFTKLPMKFGSCASTACAIDVKFIVEKLDSSDREVPRDAVASFGVSGGQVPLASTATGEAVWAAIQGRKDR